MVADPAILKKYLVQMLLPVADNDGQPFALHVWEDLKTALIEQFGGVTAYTRAPAEGVWAPPNGEQRRDDIFIVEVIVDQLDVPWWHAVRRRLEAGLRQGKIVIRALPMTPL